jgi:hypothetical protein
MPAVGVEDEPRVAPVRSGPQPRSRARLLVPIASLVAVLFVAEVTVRVAAGHLPSPQRWSAPEMQHKADQLAGWTARRGRPDVVVFGASMADDGLDPAVIDAALGRGHAAYNASLVGTPLDSIVLWAQRHVIPMLHPRLVVLGLSPVELNGNIPGDAASNKAFRDAPAAREMLGTESFWSHATRLAGDVSAVFRYRTVLRTPASLLHGRPNGGTGLGMINDPQLTSAGLNVTEHSEPYNVFLGQPVTPTMRRNELAGDLFRNFSVSPAKVALLRQWIAALQAGGARVVIVDMPVTAEAVSYLPHGAADAAASAQALADLAGAARVPFTPAGIWPTNYFGDPVHLNGQGSVALTKALTPVIESALRR